VKETAACEGGRCFLISSSSPSRSQHGSIVAPFFQAGESPAEEIGTNSDTWWTTTWTDWSRRPSFSSKSPGYSS